MPRLHTATELAILQAENDALSDALHIPRRDLNKGLLAYREKIAHREKRMTWQQQQQQRQQPR